MPRHKEKNQAPAVAPEILPAVVDVLEKAQDAALSHPQVDRVFALGVDIGRIQSMDFVATVALSVMLSVYENVKKSKAWQEMRNPKSATHGAFESLEEFCEDKLGKSQRRIQTLIQNRDTIGQDAYEQAESLGLRQVDYNAIKALPAPDQELIRQAVGSQSRDEVLDLLQELAARHATEKKALSAKLAESSQELATKQKRIGTYHDRVVALQDELDELKDAPEGTPPLIAATDWPDAFKVLMDQAHFAEKNIKIQMGSLAAISQEALKPEAAGPDEEASLNRAREVLAEQLMAIHKGIVKYQDQVGALFDKTLGAFAAEGLYK